MTFTGAANGSAVTVAGQSWTVQSGTADGVAIGSDGASARFHAAAGERADFDPPRKIRAELAGARRFAKGETMYLEGVINVDPGTVIAGTDWCSVIQIHQADTRRADGSLVLASPMFSVDLRLDVGGSPLVRIRGETGTGSQPTFSPIRILGTAPFAYGQSQLFRMIVVDGHGSPGRIAFWLNGSEVCDFEGPTGYEYVDVLANAYQINGAPQLTGSYLKLGVYTGKDTGDVPPAGVTVGFTLSSLSVEPSASAGQPMSTYTVSPKPIRVGRNRPGSLPMRWQSPSGAAINVTGFAISAAFLWSGVRRQVAITRDAEKMGRFTASWTANQVADIPSGQIADLRVTVTDAAGSVNDFVFPVIGDFA